jgi:hydroxylamine dehydrogenase
LPSKAAAVLVASRQLGPSATEKATVIEQKLFVMYLEHRMRTFQGTFHGSPDYALWYGWSEMQRDLTEIRELAADMRRAQTKTR